MKPTSARLLDEKQWSYLEKRLKEGPTKKQQKMIKESKSIRTYNNIKERK